MLMPPLHRHHHPTVPLPSGPSAQGKAADANKAGAPSAAAIPDSSSSDAGARLPDMAEPRGPQDAGEVTAHGAEATSCAEAREHLAGGAHVIEIGGADERSEGAGGLSASASQEQLQQPGGGRQELQEQGQEGEEWRVVGIITLEDVIEEMMQVRVALPRGRGPPCMRAARPCAARGRWCRVLWGQRRRPRA